MTKDRKDGTQSDRLVGVQVKEQQGLETEGSGVFREEEGDQYDRVGSSWGKVREEEVCPRRPHCRGPQGPQGFGFWPE